MEVLEVYDKDNWQTLKSYGENPFLTMDEFFQYNPEFSDANYRKNLDSLQLFKVDEEYSWRVKGEYILEHNIITYINENAISHEIFHVASCNADTLECGFTKCADSIGGSLEEGMTEYLKWLAFKNSTVEGYFLETFCVMMMENIPNIFKYYFENGFDNFIKLFPNKKNIYSLLYALDFYSKEIADAYNLKKCIYSVFDSLTDICLSFCHSSLEKKEFLEKYIDSLREIELGVNISKDFRRRRDIREFSLGLEDYSYRLIKEKIGK